MGDFDIYSTIASLDPSCCYALLRPPVAGQDLQTYRLQNQRVLDILSGFNGVPIVCDIVPFFETLCDLLFPHEHISHAVSVRGTFPKLDLKSQFTSWASGVRLYDAITILGTLYQHMVEG